MNYFGKLVSNVKGFYNEINAATLTGAIDVVVVRQDDGTFQGSPFHVRFGKLGVLRSREKVVDITVNGKPVDLHMKLGEAGEAFFVKECLEEEVPYHLATSPIPSTESLMEEGVQQLHRQCQKQRVERRRAESGKENTLHGDNDAVTVIYSNPLGPAEYVGEASDFTEQYNSQGETERSTKEQTQEVPEGESYTKSFSIPIPVKRSGMWNYPLSDSEEYSCSPPFYRRSGAHPFSDLDTPIASPLSLSPPANISARGVLSDTEIEVKSSHHPSSHNKDLHEVVWQWGELPEGAGKLDKTTATEMDIIPNELLKVIKAEIHNLDSIQCLTFRKEYLKRRKTKTKAVSKRKRGDRYHKAKQNTFEKQPEGLYLDDVLAADREVAALYLHSHGASSEDNDSGLGRDSIPVSPEHIECEGPTTPDPSWEGNDILLSLCGDLKNEKTAPEHFHEQLVSHEVFCKNPSILNNPKLVIKIKNRYYNWQVAAPYLMSTLVFKRPLNRDSLKSLKYQFMPRKRRGWFSWHSTYDDQDTTDDEDTTKKVERYRQRSSKAPDKDSEQQQSQSDPGSDAEVTLPERYKKVTRLTSEQWASLNLREGPNDITFSVTTQYQGTASCSARIFLWNFYDKVVISDIDGTITRSDVLGQMLPLVGKDWSQLGVTGLYTKIGENGFKFCYLSARAIGQSQLTRDFLKSVRQGELTLPDGPVLLTPTSLIKAFQKEVIERNPQEFKIACMRDIQSLFPKSRNPFYSGFGNRINDAYAYRAVGIPISRIFSINYKGEVKHELTNTFTSSYYKLIDLVDQMFPPLTEQKSIDGASADFTTFNYWRIPPSEAEQTDSKDKEEQGSVPMP